MSDNLDQVSSKNTTLLPKSPFEKNYVSTESWSKLQAWVKETADLTQPDSVHWCTGSEEEYNSLCELLVAQGIFKKLNPGLRPNSYLACSDPTDVARVEDRTFICTENKIDAGPTNNWMSPADMKSTLKEHFKGCMKGRTLYVVPFCMGPIDSPYSKLGVEITDSAYVVVNMKLMTRMGQQALTRIENGEDFVKCLHSVGCPVAESSSDVKWPCNLKTKYIAHFPETLEVWSFGSGYGGNALLGKKCFSLRIASYMGQQEGWLAEHMLILGVQNPEGKKRYVTAAFPSACGKTNFAMMIPPKALGNWKITTVGDDIAWMFPNSETKKLHAINPEAGFFGVAPGTSLRTNPNAIQTISKNTIFTNVALTPDGDVWWEGLTSTPPEGLISWKGTAWTKDSGEPAAHPNARFTVSIENCPSLDASFEAPEGVPVSAMIFGGRRADTVPLVTMARTWTEGVYLAGSIGSETTAAATGAVGVVRRDPMAMLPFCGYNLGNYFSHWLSFEKKNLELPKQFLVNWFRKDEEGKFIWPGYGENMRVLKWIFQALDLEVEGSPTLIGLSPVYNEIDWSGSDMTESHFSKLFTTPIEKWKSELTAQAQFLAPLEEKCPKELLEVQRSIESVINLQLN